MEKPNKKTALKASKKTLTEKKELLHTIREVLKPTNRDGKTAYWLAKETGISYNTIHKYLNNTMEPSLSNLKRIAEALDVEGKDLIKF